ncbi:Asp-tRNA(Asn)/Glu-tRNA(Gln) amidotransferase subunit GatB, partial [Candidatus Saccharibacteria bacterium]|nr:Asp-tRNA(Asn)/Glu-tRNA(Gln) amidotransferase subunit GatB [Candidatus Saccharibacteria bacterium]
KTTSQRSKEDAQDYRYMPEPDLPPLNLSDEFIRTVYDNCPSIANDYRRQFHSVIASDTLEILLDYPELMRRLAEIDEKTDRKEDISYISNLFASVLLAEENASLLNDRLPSSSQLIELSEMKAKKELSSTAAKELFIKLFEEKHSSKTAKELAKELNLIQENDSAALEKIIDIVLRNPATKKAQEDYKSGQEKVLGFLVGQVMKESKGKANPATVSELLKKKLK